jgi:hypothetical protein
MLSLLLPMKETDIVGIVDVRIGCVVTTRAFDIWWLALALPRFVHVSFGGGPGRRRPLDPSLARLYPCATPPRRSTGYIRYRPRQVLLNQARVGRPDDDDDDVYVHVPLSSAGRPMGTLLYVCAGRTGSRRHVRTYASSRRSTSHLPPPAISAAAGTVADRAANATGRRTRPCVDVWSTDGRTIMHVM